MSGRARVPRHSERKDAALGETGGVRSAATSSVEQLDRPLKDAEAGDGSSLRGQLFAGPLLQLKPLAVHGI
jgi:hypothetical protein